MGQNELLAFMKELVPPGISTFFFLDPTLSPFQTLCYFRKSKTFIDTAVDTLTPVKIIGIFIGSIWVDSVGQEDHKDLIVRIYPDRCACETSVTIAPGTQVDPSRT
jgi:hypothetical protein